MASAVEMTFNIISMSLVYSYDVFRQEKNLLAAMLVAANVLIQCCSDQMHVNCRLWFGLKQLDHQ